ncbi:hypothetical protein JTB14_016768 [Gonioctena quinquepunctata]|nr:hypothetical protein JTB14_016768 [Gonioctena quinquepunctata]
MVLKEPGTPDNGTLVDSNNIQNIEVITEDGFLLTSLDYSLEDSLQPKVLTELTYLIPLDDNLNISQHQIPIQNICQSQGGNANKGCFEFIKVSGPFQENKPEHMEERESEQEPTEDDASELKHTENSENEAQHSEEDLQKVIMLPRVDMFKKVISIKRLTTYNESFVPSGSNSQNKPFAVLWNGAISGRDKEDIISSFYTFFPKYRDSSKIILWLDNFSSQNKKWYFFSFLVGMINSSEISANEIFLNFFETGHIFISADSFHHQVELSLKKIGKVYDFDDFVKAVQKAQKTNTEVKVMSHQDFFKWKDLKSEAKLKKQKKRIYLSDIVQIKATRGHFFLQSKSSFTGEFEKLDVLYRKAMKRSGILSQSVPYRTEPRGFPKMKKDAILKNLSDIMPENRKSFWINLAETNDD